MPSGADVLIIHASRHGHSGRIAERIAERLQAAGADAEVADVRHQPNVTAHDRTAVVVIGSIHAGQHAEELLSWLQCWRHSLASTPLAVASVSLKATSERPADRAEVARYVAALQDAAGGTAAIAEPLAGALQYSQYAWITRRMLRKIAEQAGLSTDLSRDTDYCDWAQVDRIAQGVAGLAGCATSEAGALVSASASARGSAPS